MDNLIHFDVSASIWLWLFPITYLAHIAEEYWGGDGYSAHHARTKGINLSPLRFLLMTGFGLVLMVIGVLVAERFNFPETLLVILATLILVNGLSHTISSALTALYNPGLVSGALIWIPLGAATLIHLRGSMHLQRYLMAMAVGIAIQGAVSLLAIKGGKQLRT